MNLDNDAGLWDSDAGELLVSQAKVWSREDVVRTDQLTLQDKSFNKRVVTCRKRVIEF